MAPRRRSSKTSDFPENLYINGIYYRYRHPQTGEYHQMGTDKKLAIQAARKLNAQLMPGNDLVRRVLGEHHFTWANLVERYQRERQAAEGKKASTTKEENYRLQHIADGLGMFALEDTTQRLLSDWLDKNYSNNAYTKHRGTLIKLMDFAIAKGMFPDGQQNLAASTLIEREAPKVRKILTIEQFNAIHARAEPWLQVAMELALVTTQRRGDLIRMKYSDITDGHLFVVQNKTEKHGERAHLKIAIGDTLRSIISRSRDLPPLSPFLIHRVPDRRVKFEGQEHHSQVRDQTLTKAFSRARDACEIFRGIPVEQRPTFHEIRGLGGAQYLAQGYSQEYVNLLMGHTTMKMTKEYTDQHGNWTECKADLKLG